LKPVHLLAFIIRLVLVAALVLSAQAGDLGLDEAIGLFQGRDYDGARRILLELRSRGLEDSDIPYYLGRVSIAESAREQAVGYFEEAIEKDRSQSIYHQWLATALVRNLPYSNILSKIRLSMRMMKELNEAIALDPSNLQARMTKARILIRSYGRAPISRDDIIGEAQVIADIDSAMGHLILAEYHHMVGEDSAAAESHFSKALELEPDDPLVTTAVADFYWDIGRKEDALALLTASWNDNAEDLQIGYELAAKLILSGEDLTKARVILSRCLDLRSESGMPTRATVHWTLGLIHHLAEEPRAAEQEWAAAAALDPEFDRFLKNAPQLEDLVSLLAGD
jgi:tetratricopeptide (TPR) repeat protein